MSWYLSYKKYKKQVKELLFYRSELEYQEEVLKEAHAEFDKYYIKFCSERNINLEDLRQNNVERVEKEYSKAEAKKEGLVHKPRSERKSSSKVFDKIYREIAKEIHPDKLSKLLSLSEANEKEEMFKKASGAMNKEDWGILLEIADRLNIKPKNFDGMAEEIKKEIKRLKNLIENNEKMFSWAFINADSDEERDQVIRNFLSQLFGYVVDKSD
tara:strand:+ start:6501 stop:7139 length:639 start_codon:yes stop_codon:yes gene_type:complete